MYSWMNDHKENTLVTYKNLRSPSKPFSISTPFQPLLLHLSNYLDFISNHFLACDYSFITQICISEHHGFFLAHLKKKSVSPLSFSFLYSLSVKNLEHLSCGMSYSLDFADCVWMMQFSMFLSFVCPANWQLDPEAWLNLCLIPLADQRWWVVWSFIRRHITSFFFFVILVAVDAWYQIPLTCWGWQNGNVLILP